MNSDPKDPTKEAKQSDTAAGIIFLVIVVVAALLIGRCSVGLFSSGDKEITAETVVGGIPNEESPAPANSQGLSRNEIPLTAIAINVFWEDQGRVWNSSGSSHGSAAVFDSSWTRLRLITNRHCLGLDELAERLFQSPLGNYQIKVTFPSGETRDVSRIAHEEGVIDLAFLEVRRSGLQEGRDYIQVQHLPDLGEEVGDRLVAVGSPHGLAGTHTYGHISALRRDGYAEQNWKLIQTDAALNPGNSGGPLFLDRGGSYYWIGVNTFQLGGPGLNFAIHAGELKNHKFRWFSADANGAADILRTFYGLPDARAVTQ